MTETPSSSDYILLADAAKHSPYSQEYLSLRARQGKLRAVKRGRNWFTTLGWLDDYFHYVEEAKSDLWEAVDAQKLATQAIDSEFDVRQPVGLPQIEESKSIGTVLEPEPQPRHPTFDLSYEEPKRPNLAHEQLFSQLQEKVDTTIDREGPFISLDFDNDQPISDRFIELGMNQDEDQSDIVSELSDKKEERSVQPSLNWLLKPSLALATFVIITFGLVALDGPLEIHQSVAAGYSAIVNRSSKNVIVSADSAQISSSDLDKGGTVAGVSDESTDIGFWSTVGVGLLSLFGLYR